MRRLGIIILVCTLLFLLPSCGNKKSTKPELLSELPDTPPTVMGDAPSAPVTDNETPEKAETPPQDTLPEQSATPETPATTPELKSHTPEIASNSMKTPGSKPPSPESPNSEPPTHEPPEWIPEPPEFVSEPEDTWDGLQKWFEIHTPSRYMPSDMPEMPGWSDDFYDDEGWPRLEKFMQEWLIAHWDIFNEAKDSFMDREFRVWIDSAEEIIVLYEEITFDEKDRALFARLFSECHVFEVFSAYNEIRECQIVSFKVVGADLYGEGLSYNSKYEGYGCEIPPALMGDDYVGEWYFVSGGIR
jgi:hypothetical protein